MYRVVIVNRVSGEKMGRDFDSRRAAWRWFRESVSAAVDAGGPGGSALATISDDGRLLCSAAVCGGLACEAVPFPRG